MFGYVNVNGKELSDEDRNTYQSYYCGLCRSLKENFGSKGQMLLNYDMTFLIVLLTGLYEFEEEKGSFTCAIHPLKKRDSIQSEITDYAAHMNVILAYYNLVDDWKDEKKLTRLGYARLLEGKNKKI